MGQCLSGSVLDLGSKKNLKNIMHGRVKMFVMR